VVSESERRESKEGKVNKGKIVIDKRATIHPSEPYNHKWVIKQSLGRSIIAIILESDHNNTNSWDATQEESRQ
jgi:hypothetical protein